MPQRTEISWIEDNSVDPIHKPLEQKKRYGCPSVRTTNRALGCKIDKKN